MEKIHHLTSTGSTNEVAVAAGREGAPHGSVWLADSQSQGKGRLGRHWESKPGVGLYFSLLLRPTMKAAMAPLSTLATGLALAEALRKLGLKDLVVKWPNDLIVGGRKLGGILTEMVHRGDGVDFLVIGVGINLQQDVSDFSPELQGSAISLRQALGQSPERDELLQIILPAISKAIERLTREGAQDLRQRWEKESGMVGRALSYAATESGLARQGRVLGLDAEGRLRVEHEDGSVAELIAEDTTLL